MLLVLILAHLNFFFIFNFVDLLVLIVFYLSFFQSLIFFSSLLLIETFRFSSPLFLGGFISFPVLLRIFWFFFVFFTLILWIILIKLVFFLFDLFTSLLFNKYFCVNITEAIFGFNRSTNFIHRSEKVDFGGFNIWTHIDGVLFWATSASALIEGD